MRNRRSNRSFRAAIEVVEQRRLLAAVTWDGGGDGINWTDANNWSANALPTAADDVTISIAANPSLILASGTQSIKSLVCDEALRLNGGTLSISTTADINNTLTMSGGTISGGAYDVTGGSLVATSGGGTLANVAITGEILLNTTSANIVLSGTPTFTAARLSANSSSLRLAPGATLNSLVVAEGASAGTRSILLGFGGATTNTFGPSAIVRLANGCGGDLSVTNSSSATLINNGLITSEASGRTLSIPTTSLINNGTLELSAGTFSVNSTSWTNPGTINATGGTLDLAGTFDATAGIGTMNTSAATVRVSGIITNTGNTITLNASTGSWQMFGGTINNGSMNLTAGTNVLGTSSGGTLSNLAITGELLMNTTSAAIGIAGITTFTAARLAANAASLRLLPGTTLNSLVVAEGAATGTRTILGGFGGVGTATLGPSAVVRLAAGCGGGLSIQNSSTTTLINNGLITAEAFGQTLTISTTALTNNGTLAVSSGTLASASSNWTNAGTISGTGGTFQIDGTLNATAGIGTFNTSAISVLVAGAITNAGNTITLNGSTGSWRMSGGSINNGSMNLTAGTSLIGTTGSGTLSSVAITGDVLLNTSGAAINLAGNTTFSAARLSASGASLRMVPGATLDSLVVAEGATAGTRNILFGFGGVGTNTIGPSGIIRLASGVGGALDLQNSSAATVINNGLISNESSQQLGLSMTSFTNNATVSNSGTGILRIAATTWTNPGTINGTAGTVQLDGTFNATGGIGTFNTSAASVQVAGTINNAGNTITLNAASGSWRMFGGSINNGSMNLTGGTNLLCTSSGGTLSSLAITGEVLLNTSSANIAIAGNTSFSAARLSGTSSSLRLAPGATLNSLVVAEGAATGARTILLGFGGAGTGTFGASAVVRLAAGSGAGLAIQNSSSSTLINNGLITAEAAGQSLTISNSGLTNNGTLAVSAGTMSVSAGLWTNPGTINASGGTLSLDGALDATAGIGAMNTSGATVNVAGTINNTGNTITLNANTGSWRMAGGAINNGTLNLTGGTNLLGTSSAGTISNLTVNGEILLNTTSAALTLSGNNTFNAIRLTASSSQLRMAPGSTLNGLVVAEGATTGARSILVGFGGTGTNTFGPSAVVRLAAGSGGSLSIQNSSSATLVNNGLITAEATGQSLTISPSVFTNNATLAVSAGTITVNSALWTNPGTISGTGGTVQLDGTFDATAGIGTMNTSAATVNVAGTVNNTGNTITLTGTTGSWRMFGGTINNGTLTLTGGTNLIATSSAGTISNLTVNGEILFNTTSAALTLAGNNTFTAARLAANNAQLRMAPGAVLNSLVVAEGAATGNRSILLCFGGIGTNTFGPSAVVRLASGCGGGLVIQNSSIATLVNEGLITAEATGQILSISNSVFSNLAAGTVRADGSTISINTQTGPSNTLTAPGFWQLRNGARLSTGYNANIVDLNLSITGTGNAFGGSLINTFGVNELRNSMVFAAGATFSITPIGGTLKLAGVVDLAADSRLNVTGGVRFAGANPVTVRTGIASATSMGRIVASGVVDLSNPDGGQVRFDPDLVGGYDPPSGTRFNAITGSNVLNDLGAFFGGTTPSGLILLVGRDNTALYSIVGTGTPPPAPSIVNTAFEFETREAVNFTFNSNVSAFVSRGDLKITNLGTNQIVPNTQGVMSYDPSGLTASLLTGGTTALPNGKYRIEIQASDISNAAGDPLTTPLVFEFFILRGDANRDRVVDFTDLLIIAQNYGLTGRTFSQGNFNYSADGLVNFDDLLIISQAYGTSVPALSEIATPKRVRSSEVVEDVLS